MNDVTHELKDWLVRTQREQLGTNMQLGQIQERPKIRYTELPEDLSNSPNAKEWNFYRREVGRLLAEGNEGRWVLIKGEKIIGIADTESEVNQLRLKQFFMQPVLMKQIREWEPVLRGGG